MLIPFLAGCALTILLILFWPRRSPYTRRVTSNYNGRPYGADRE